MNSEFINEFKGASEELTQILLKEQVTIEEVLDFEDLLQELKFGHPKLIQ